MFPGQEDELPIDQGNWNAIAISEDIAKEAFIQYVASKCCYSKEPVREMVIHERKPFNTYRYRLETFAELRTCTWITEPYLGEAVDSSPHGEAPYPWDVAVQQPALFTNENKKIRVPHTSSIMDCSDCGGCGKVTCTRCNGRKTITCPSCGGRGKQFDHRCYRCSGGRIRCSHCSGWGRRDCNNCRGKGKLLRCLGLTVKWTNNIFEQVMDQGFGFPTKYFKNISGQKLVFDEQKMVSPVTDFPENALNQISQNAVEEHQAQFAGKGQIKEQFHDPAIQATWNVFEQPEAQFPSTTQILRQRQVIELIYLTRVEYEWRGKFYSYYVYGNEHKVYTEYYPKKYCCTLL